MSPHHWINNWDPVLLPITEKFGIRYYGTCYILGFALAYWLLLLYARDRRSLLPAARVGDFMTAMIIGVMIGGRLGYFLLYQASSAMSDPLAILRVWDGGMSSHGGFAGVVVATWWFSRSQKIPFLHLGDLAATATPPGLLLVRLANFINGELWGKVSTVPWAVIFPRSEPDQPLAEIPPRHPSQLYEAGMEGLLLLIFVQWRFWRSDVTRQQPGRLAGEFLAAYGVVRIAVEFFRQPDAPLILGLSRGMFYSVFLIAAGVFLIARRPDERRAGRSAR